MLTLFNRRLALRQLLRGATVPLGLLVRPSQAGLLPALEDLEPRWNQLGIGMTVEQALALMGDAPAGREQSEWLGLRVDDLLWRDLRSSYRARFLANKAYAKTLTRHTNSLFGLTTATTEIWSPS